MESPEIPVDVVVVVRYLTYTEYASQRSYKRTEGIGLYLPTESRWTASYPHLHRRNGVGKEKATNWWFRRTIRMFKNASLPCLWSRAGWRRPRRGRTK